MTKKLIAFIVYGTVSITVLAVSFIGFCVKYIHPIIVAKKA